MKVLCKFDEMFQVEYLRPYPKNRNQHTPEQIKRLAELLKYQGIRAPIIVAKPFDCIAKGHGTLEAIKLNGWQTAPVVYQDFDDEDQLYAFVQSDNGIAAWANLDLAAINVDVTDLGPDFDIDLLGIENFNLDPPMTPEAEEPKSGQQDKTAVCPYCSHQFVLGEK